MGRTDGIGLFSTGIGCPTHSRVSNEWEPKGIHISKAINQWALLAAKIDGLVWVLASCVQRPSITFLIRSKAHAISSLVMVKGGAMRITWSCVSLHKMPNVFRASQ